MCICKLNVIFLMYKLLCLPTAYVMFFNQLLGQKLVEIPFFSIFRSFFLFATFFLFSNEIRQDSNLFQEPVEQEVGFFTEVNVRLA